MPAKEDITVVTWQTETARTGNLGDRGYNLFSDAHDDPLDEHIAQGFSAKTAPVFTKRAPVRVEQEAELRVRHPTERTHEIIQDA